MEENREIVVDEIDKCPVCGGTGKIMINGEEQADCPECKALRRMTAQGPNFWRMEY